MKNRGVFSASPRLPGVAHKTGGRPKTLPGQIAAPIDSHRDSGSAVGVAEPEQVPVAPASSAPRRFGTSLSAASAAEPKRKYSLSLRIAADLVAGFEQVLRDYPASSRKAIRRGLAMKVQERLARDLSAPPPERAGEAACSTIRLDLRIDAATVATLQRCHDPHELMPVTAMLSHAVEPAYAALLRDLLHRTGNPRQG